MHDRLDYAQQQLLLLGVKTERKKLKKKAPRQAKPILPGLLLLPLKLVLVLDRAPPAPHIHNTAAVVASLANKTACPSLSRSLTHFSALAFSNPSAILGFSVASTTGDDEF